MRIDFPRSVSVAVVLIMIVTLVISSVTFNLKVYPSQGILHAGTINWLRYPDPLIRYSNVSFLDDSGARVAIFYFRFLTSEVGPEPAYSGQLLLNSLVSYPTQIYLHSLQMTFRLPESFTPVLLYDAIHGWPLLTIDNHRAPTVVTFMIPDTGKGSTGVLLPFYLEYPYSKLEAYNFTVDLQLTLYNGGLWYVPFVGQSYTGEISLAFAVSSNGTVTTQ